jgi:signal transduction histidine kinase
VNADTSLNKKLLAVLIASVVVLTGVVIAALEVGTSHLGQSIRTGLLENGRERLRRLRERVTTSFESEAKATGTGTLDEAILLRLRPLIIPLMRDIIDGKKGPIYIFLALPTGDVAIHEGTSVDVPRIRESAPPWIADDDMTMVEIQSKENSLVLHCSLPVLHGGHLLGTLNLGISGDVIQTRTTSERSWLVGLLWILGFASMATLLVTSGAIWSLAFRASRSRLAETRRLHLAELGTLVEGVVHEVRNPLNSLRMQAASIRNRLREILAFSPRAVATGSGPPDRGPEEVLSQLDRMEAEILRLDELAQGILAFGAPAPPDPIPSRPARTTRELVEFLEPELRDHSIAVDLAVSPGLGDVFVNMDTRRLRQVILNLLHNARQAMADGGTLRVQVAKTTGKVRIIVSDTGPGIPADVLPKIFHPFFTTKEKGYGLGLSIARNLVEDSGGTLSVQSSPGKGATFFVDLPVTRPARSSEARHTPEDRA